MKKLFILLFCLAAFCGAMIFLVNYSSPTDPVWQGKKLSQWLREETSHNRLNLTDDAHEAIRAMGTNALPYLLNLAGEKDSSISLELRKRPSLGYLGFLRQLAPTHAADRICAANGLQALGKEAVPALPELMRILEDERPDSSASVTAARALVAIGEPAISSLLQTLTNTQNTTIKLNVMRSLGEIGKEPDVVVPKLMEQLAATNSWFLRAETASVIGKFGEKARMALPALIALQNDPNPVNAVMRQKVSDAINDIQPGPTPTVHFPFETR
jgi:HEAT repeat protein